MKKYLAISIGPIIKTFSMARKPREFWAASYLFSYLMQSILEVFDNEKKTELLSPYYKKGDEPKIGVGLFPDRAFYKIKGADINVDGMLKEALFYFACRVNLPIQVVNSFFCIMTVCEDYETSSQAIDELNKQLDWVELNQNTWSPDDFDTVLRFLQHTTNDNPSPLFEIAFGKKRYPIDTLEEMANPKNMPITYSYQRYVCIVQADGDNMGSIVSSSQMEGQLFDFSQNLMEFGKSACTLIDDFDGLPIYAGGDDLLFIAPVCGKGGKTIFDLIETIDEKYKQIQEIVREKNIEVKKNGITEKINTSMSYGISVIYYKYPLYEAWEIARNMLFGFAKKQVDGKNAIALNLRKNSGSDFRLMLSKSSDEYSCLKSLIESTPGETLVSSVAHKVRTNTPLLGTFGKENLSSRLSAFFTQIIDTEDKSTEAKKYLDETRKVLELIMGNYIEKKVIQTKESTEKDTTQQATELFYSMLRIAKFIKGEEVKDE